MYLKWGASYRGHPIKFFRSHNQPTIAQDFGKNRRSPIAMGGLQIVLRATFKIDDSKRFLLLRLKELIQKNYELLDQPPQSPIAIDEEESHASDNQRTF